MSTNKILIAGVVAGIAAFLLGWVFYGMLLQGVFETYKGPAPAECNRPEEEMIWWALILANIAYGVILAYIFGKWATISTALSGLKAGALIGFFFALSIDMSMYAMSNIMTLTGAIIDVIVWTVLSALVGAVAAWILGRGK